jgi:purine-binding chemotaxis protein CheW
MASDRDPLRRLTVRAAGAPGGHGRPGVAEVIRAPRITRMPHAPPGLLGVTHLRGVVLPVVSLGSLLGGRPSRRDARGGAAPRSADRPGRRRCRGPEGFVDGDEAAPQHGRLMLDDADGARWFDLDEALDERFAAFEPPERVRRAPTSPRHRAVEDLAFLGFTLAGQDYACRWTRSPR